MFEKHIIQKSFIAITMFAMSAFFLGLTISPKISKAETMKIAYLSPSFDISDAWERVFWAIQGPITAIIFFFSQPFLIMKFITFETIPLYAPFHPA